MMVDENDNSKMNSLGGPAQFCLVGLTVIGVILYCDNAPDWLGNSVKSGANLTRTLGCGVAGLLGAAFGFGMILLARKIKDRPRSGSERIRPGEAGTDY